MLESLKVKLKEFMVIFNNKLIELGPERLIIALIVGSFNFLLSTSLITTFLFAIIGFFIINEEKSTFTNFDKTTYILSLILCGLPLLMSLL